jgi:transposase-like protein
MAGQDNAADYFGPSYVRKISPYIAGKPISEVAREFGLDEASIVKLASNENPLGMPASAKAASPPRRRIWALSGQQRLRAEGETVGEIRCAGRVADARQR